MYSYFTSIKLLNIEEMKQNLESGTLNDKIIDHSEEAVTGEYSRFTNLPGYYPINVQIKGSYGLAFLQRDESNST